MIVELFGAPTAGKTTFACALNTHLKGSGASVDLIQSFRPGEAAGPPIPALKAPQAPFPGVAAFSRLARSAVELVKATGLGMETGGLASELLALLPARSLFWSVRLYQYIMRLERSWARARGPDAIVIFDQGFVQAICSLELLSRTPSHTAMSRAVALIPRADLYIKLDASRPVLTGRLEGRRRQQGSLERCLELDTETNLRSIGIVDTLHQMLLSANAEVIQVSCLDRPDVTQAVCFVEDFVGGQRARARRAAC